MKKIPPWLWVTGIAVGVWYLSKPKTSGTVSGAGTSLGSGALGHDAGRHHGGHHHIGHRGFVGHSVDLVNYAEPLVLECDPRYPCAAQPVLPCRCG